MAGGARWHVHAGLRTRGDLTSTVAVMAACLLQHQCSTQGVLVSNANIPAASVRSSSSRDGRISINECQDTAQCWHNSPIRQQRRRRGPVCTAASSARDSSIRLFLDSASLSSWDALSSTRMFTGVPALLFAADPRTCCQAAGFNKQRCAAGVTTNPAILQKDGVECSVESLQRFAATVSLRRGEHTRTSATC